MAEKSNKKQTQNFQVQMKFQGETFIEVRAENFEEALEISKGFTINDVVVIKGEIFDYDIEIKGVFRS